VQVYGRFSDILVEPSTDSPNPPAPARTLVNESPALLPGKWYVSVPAPENYYTSSLGGPFDTEREARDWLLCLPAILGAAIWQCAAPLLTADELAAAARACAALRLPRTMSGQFRTFLVRRLKDNAPAVAAKVHAASGADLAAIYADVLRLLSQAN
jgi:hypothetical protein